MFNLYRLLLATGRVPVVARTVYNHSIKPIRAFSASSYNLSSPPIDENGLYYGKFTKEEYENAAKYIKLQIENLETEIKGEVNVRDNVGKMPQFPLRDSGASEVKNLSDLFTQTIKTTGPIPLSAYMRQCLTHPEFGYYTTRNPLDRNEGDFITSPEISSVFGEMIGIWLLTVWQQQGKPSSIRVVEFGPGKGTLVHDVLKSFNKLAKSAVSIEINLIEASHVLRKEQWKLLCDQPLETTPEGFNVSTTRWGNSIKWLDTEKDIAHDGSVANYILAHEFFDALPVKGFKKTEHGWRELVVEHTPSVVNTQSTLPEPEQAGAQKVDDELLDTQFHLTVSPKETPSSIIPKLSPRYKDLEVGAQIEICTEAELYIMKMAQLINNEKKLGGVLVIDYGVVGQIPEMTLRGIYKHKFVSPFIKPGEVDLSIDVDFDNLVDLSSKCCAPFGPVNQGDWLHNLGIGYRVDQLLKKNSENYEEQEKIYNAYQRLTGTDEKSMGSIYKFLCLMPHGSETPVGFGGSA
ncbi:DUF185-domain-containing protein [Suhomyces tanzawaensis NRRL Y-17324]|uniref:Protein arginine methyltransferase NDUFAF7 n=1 Tax=Suhomyces tanzawaensis NRRL Y-17324 TaxID=984487 RepID=A0A1E4SP93_9ASCO|nr:DUF185-domain-containing protein [Suhomyces tanzawaensis NRRL Y-17324]ODV81202.1 DUF185-domain-containing protein [Suhomyces tanzawaensis NRRL Y-17324]